MCMQGFPLPNIRDIASYGSINKHTHSSGVGTEAEAMHWPLQCLYRGGPGLLAWCSANMAKFWLKIVR